MAAFDSVGIVPDHFLHVWLGPALGVDAATAQRAWKDVAPFAIDYRGVNCFHDAVVVEAHTDGVAELAERALPHVSRAFLLPHMSVGYFRRVGSPAALRATLEPLRDFELGEAIVREVLLCEIPIAKSTILQPWTVIGSVRLQP